MEAVRGAGAGSIAAQTGPEREMLHGPNAHFGHSPDGAQGLRRQHRLMTTLPLRSPLVRSAGLALCSALLLAGCGSSKNAGVRSADPGIAAPAAKEELPPLPQLGDPVYAAMLERVNAEYRRWLANPDAYLVAPAQATPWPCAVPAEERDKLAGVPNPRDPKTLAAYAKQERAAGMKRGTIKPPGVENAQVYLLKGACVKGKLQGEVELLAVYTSVIQVLDDETRIPIRILKRFNAQAGKPVGAIYTALLQGAQQRSKPSSINVKSLSATFSLDEVAPATTPPGRGVSISYSGTETPKPGFGTWTQVTQHVYQTVPLKGDRWKRVTYHGGTKINEANFKGDQLHGRSNSYAYEFKSAFSKDPIRMPASEICYDHGEQIKSTACDVD
jgi:hypothetical protein